MLSEIKIKVANGKQGYRAYNWKNNDRVPIFILFNFSTLFDVFIQALFEASYSLNFHNIMFYFFLHNDFIIFITFIHAY